MRRLTGRAIGAGLVVGALLAAARPIAAQSATAGDGGFSFGAALDSASAAQLAEIVDGARAHRLPVDPIVAKARLGILRHAPAATIVGAARAVAERLETARAALDPLATSTDIAAGADALGSGVNADALRSVRRAAPARSVSVPLGVLAQLVASGVPVKRATAIVTDLLHRGAPATQLVALGNDVDADVRAGERADVSLGMRLRQLNAVLGPPGAAAANGATFGTDGPTAAGKKP